MPSSSKTTVHGGAGESEERKARPGVKVSDCISLSRYDRSSAIWQSVDEREGGPRLRVPEFKMGWPQRLAALLLFLFLAQCTWVISRQQLSTDDYRFARCGREMWENPSPLAGYFTSCGNLNGDGTFGYRVAGFPLTTQRLVLLAIDKMRSPE